MDQLLPYTDLVTPPTPDNSDYALPSPASSYHTPYTSLMSPAALAPVMSPTSSYAPSYLPVPSPAGSSYVQLSPMGSSPSLPQPYHSSPSLSIMQGYQNLSLNFPALASPMSFYSLNSPAMASTSSFHSISQNNSPAIPISPLPAVESPARWPVALPVESPSKHVLPCYPRRRKPIPQSIQASFKRDTSVEHFKLDGASGVPVRGILDGTVLPDGHDERVLERTGVRQIRLVVTVSLSS